MAGPLNQCILFYWKNYVTNHLSDTWQHQVYFYLRTFAPTVPSAWKTFPKPSHAGSFLLFQVSAPSEKEPSLTFSLELSFSIRSSSSYSQYNTSPPDIFFFFQNFYLFSQLYLFWAVLSRHCFIQAFLGLLCAGLSLQFFSCYGAQALGTRASVVLVQGLSSCGVQAPGRVGFRNTAPGAVAGSLGSRAWA